MCFFQIIENFPFYAIYQNDYRFIIDRLVMFFSWYYIIFLFEILIVIIYFYFYSKKFVKNYDYKILNEEIIIKRGVFKIKTIIIPYDKIESIKISSGFSERIKKIYTINFEIIKGRYNILIIRLFLILIIILMWIYSLLYHLTLFQFNIIFFPLILLIGFIKSGNSIPGLKNPNIIIESIKEKMINLNQNRGNELYKSNCLVIDNFISNMVSRINEGSTFKSSLKEIREKVGLSISDLAERVKIPIKMIQQLEEGKFRPSLFIAYKIADVLMCNVEDLFSL